MWYLFGIDILEFMFGIIFLYELELDWEWF